MQDSEAIIEKAASIAHEVNRALQRHLGEEVSPRWETSPDWQKRSIKQGVKAVLLNPLITPEDQHQAWVDYKKTEGWVHGPIKDVVRKEHPCLLPYSELPQEQQLKDLVFGAVVRAVLVGEGVF